MAEQARLKLVASGLLISAVAVVAGCSSGSHSTSAAPKRPASPQAVRTCADRWNQGNMIGWGPGPANVAFRRPNAKEHSTMQLPSRRQCIVATPAGGGTWTCVLTSTGAYWCPPLHEPTGPPLKVLGRNATMNGRGVLKLDPPLKGTHPTPALAWQRYPHTDGFIHPWTSNGKLRQGLRFKGPGERGRCFVVDETALLAVSCLNAKSWRYNACFPRRSNWRTGDVAACAGEGDISFTRWTITGGTPPDAPVLVPWRRIGGFYLGEQRLEVQQYYGLQPDLGYRLHGGRVQVTYSLHDRVDSILFSTPYYRTKSGFGVGSRNPPGHRWHGFLWDAWNKGAPCNCWVKVGRRPQSLPATTKNFLKPWTFIYVRHGRVSSFYFASRFVD